MTEEKKSRVIEYAVVAQVQFKVLRPETADKDSLIKGIWKEMPANNIGENLFVRFPGRAFDFQLNIDAAPVTVNVPDAIEAEVVKDVEPTA